MSIKDNVKERRLRLGLSQEELAIKTGYKSKSSIARIELGETDINQKKLAVLANALDTTIDGLVDFKEEKMLSAQKGYKNIVIIQAGGKSTRNTMNVPNQFINVDGKPVLVYVMEAYETHPDIDEIYVACLNGWESIVRSYAKRFGIRKLCGVVTGGDSILISTKNAIEQIASPSMEDRVILQESTRPLINQDLISKLLSSFEKFGSTIMVKDMSDYVTLTLNGPGQAEYLSRPNIRVLESPEIYSYKTINLAFAKAKEQGIKDDNNSVALLLHRLGMPLNYCESNVNNIKIIRQEDIYLFKMLKNIIL
jgi:2-C-methyl-D-erythritol 4-phosphate cytidylyltransferase